MKCIYLILTVFLALPTMAQENNVDCESIKEGYFTYMDEGEKMYIYRTLNKQYEWDSKMTVMSSGTIRWEGDCDYYLKFEEINIMSNERFKDFADPEQLDSFVLVMKEIILSTELVAHVGETTSEGYWADIKFFGKLDKLSITRIPHKEGKQSFKKVEKALVEWRKKKGL